MMRRTAARWTSALLVALLVSVISQAARVHAADPPATQPTTEPFVDPGNARSIVYVCQASGAMIAHMGTLKLALSREIDLLGADVKFDIIFYQNETAIALDHNQLLAATAENKRLAMKFLDDVTTSGTGDPTKALELAWRLRPELIYFQRCYDFDDNAAALAKFRALQQDHRAKVHTIAFTDRKIRDDRYIEVLKTYAAESDGAFRNVDADALERQQSVQERARRHAGAAAAAGPDAQKQGPVFEKVTAKQRVIFVCDASGSMISKMASLKAELAKAVNALDPAQSFDIIFMQDNHALALDRTNLLLANDAGKRKLAKFLDDVSTSGPSDPMAAVRLAFRLKPQLIYLLTDGDFPDNEALVAEIKKLNANQKVIVNTIAFVNDKDTDTEFLGTLKKIAKESGGQFKHVAENELEE